MIRIFDRGGDLAWTPGWLKGRRGVCLVLGLLLLGVGAQTAAEDGKVWDVYTPIELVPPNPWVIIHEHEIGGLGLVGRDKDHWVQDSACQHTEGTAADGITYNWGEYGTEANITWPAPGFIGVTDVPCTVDDEGVVNPPDTGTRNDDPLSASVRVYLVTTCRHMPDGKLECPCGEGVCLNTQSATNHRNGSQSFSVPLTSWDCRGTSFGFGLTYSSRGLVDPEAPAPTPDLSWLSEENSKWSHTYAQWVDLYHNPDGQPYVVWHHDGSYTSFRYGLPNSADEKVELGPWTLLSPPIPLYGGMGAGAPAAMDAVIDYPTETRVHVASWVKVTEADGTEYHFNLQPPMGQDHVLWSVGPFFAIPHYLLTRIRDRWGREVNVTWESPYNRWRVQRVVDSAGGTLALGYNGDGLLSTVSDPQGRTHYLSYTQVPNGSGALKRKLAGAIVQGAGAPDRTVHTWDFSYRDEANPGLAYGGTYTGDLVIAKTEPDGKEVFYRYLPVTWPRVEAKDWDGVVARISWWEMINGQEVEKAITRTREGDGSVTMAFPGGAQTHYTYDEKNNLASVTDLATGRTWSYTYDETLRRLLTVRTPLEQGTASPLVEHAYDWEWADGRYHVTRQTTRVRQEDDALGDAVETTFNALSLPAQVTAFARQGSGLANQVTQFLYDGGGALTVGNLTKVIEALGSGVQQETNLAYEGNGLAWGLPTRVMNAVGAESTFDYDIIFGRLLTASSPNNLVVGQGDPDYPPSVTTLAYTLDGLPALITDPEGHTVGINYCAAEPGSPNLRVTYWFEDETCRWVVLDAAGRPIDAADENGVRTWWGYDTDGRTTSVRRAVGTAEEALTTFDYDLRGDLVRIVPPNGYDSRTEMEYVRYGQDGTLDGTYEGQVTHVAYPDATHEYFGYNGAGEMEWRRKPDGTLITLDRDALHRVKTVHFPTSQGYSGFDVNTTYDEFGRLTSSERVTHGPPQVIETTSYTYDDLNRTLTATPPGPQRGVSYAYTRDETLKRWITNVTLAGMGDFIYQEDTKGRLASLRNHRFQWWSFSYDRDGKNTLLLHPNGTSEERAYTGRDWLASIVLKGNGGAVQDTFDYYYTDAFGSYDGTGHVRREVSGVGTRAFTYDSLYRLALETHPDVGSTGYTYDANGNRLAKTANGATDYYGVDFNNKLLWVNRGSNQPPTPGQALPYTLFTYDTNGRMTGRERRHDDGSLRPYAFVWDGDDRLRWADEGGVLRFYANYNNEGLRVHRYDVWGGAHNFAWGPGGVLEDAGTYYTPGLAHRSGGVDRFYHGDALGSTRWLSDTNGAFTNGLRYDAYGKKTGQTGGSWQPVELFLFAGAWGYQSEYSDASEPGVGLHYLQQRYYDPETGRFISPDPIGYAGGLNLYAYCGNDPVNRVDPSGLQYGVNGPDHSGGMEQALRDWSDYESDAAASMAAAGVGIVTPEQMGASATAEQQAAVVVTANIPRAAPGGAAAASPAQQAVRLVTRVGARVGAAIRSLLPKPRPVATATQGCRGGAAPPAGGGTPPGTPPAWVKTGGNFVSWLKEEYNNTGRMTTVEEANRVVAFARTYGQPIHLHSGHPGTPWPDPHLNIGTARNGGGYHVRVPKGYVLP